MAQINPLVGDIAGNTQHLISVVHEAIEQYTPDLVVFPELALTAYPPEDLLLRPSLDRRIEKALQQILAQRFPLHLVLGYPGRQEGRLYNMLAVIHEDSIIARYRKQCLPNYQVFDEKRYFDAGSESCVLTVKGLPVAFTICEDLWREGPMRKAVMAGARLMININGSPFHKDKPRDRQKLLRQRASEGNIPIVYINQVGGQDELVFDGGSMAVDAQGELQVMSPLYEEALTPVLVDFVDGRAQLCAGRFPAEVSVLEGVYRALVLGVRDYVAKNGFPGVVLGLSGGIDSALSLAIAVDALGPERVQAVMMPYHYTAEISQEDARRQAELLGVHYRVLPIATMVEAFEEPLEQELGQFGQGVTLQNLQARCRGVLLMAISNEEGLLVLTTSNKSENAVGYSTLYGDMAGGFNVLKDVPKMMVYELARWRNESFEAGPREVIPPRVIERAPSAELAPGQLDEDNLPPYPVLDAILERYIEQDESAREIVEAGFDAAVVQRILGLVDRAEYKRRQAPIGPRISTRGFGRDRRYPITSGWEPGE